MAKYLNYYFILSYLTNSAVQMNDDNGISHILLEQFNRSVSQKFVQYTYTLCKHFVTYETACLQTFYLSVYFRNRPAVAFYSFYIVFNGF